MKQWPPWTVVHQAALSMGFSRQEYWSGLPFPPPGDLPEPDIKLLHLLCWRADSLPPSHLGSPVKQRSHSCSGHLLVDACAVGSVWGAFPALSGLTLICPEEIRPWGPTGQPRYLQPSSGSHLVLAPCRILEPNTPIDSLWMTSLSLLPLHVP